jgi:hypothetical protein
MDQNSSGSQNPADGFYIGGRPNNSANAYNIYLLRTSSPARDYFLNSVGTSSDNRVRHSVFIMDYTATIEVEGGSTVRLVSADPNCSAIKNCAEPDVASVCNAVTYPNLDAAIASDIGSQPYNGQFIGFKVMGVALAQ